MNKNFYDMVKYWTISDYKTPGIKAEVILDMLISEFITELLWFRFDADEAALLTKEFPIDIKKGSLNAKVDYLACVDRKKLLLIELKTDKDSYNDPQRARMEKAKKCGVEELLKFYKKIATLKTLKSPTADKYIYSLKMYERNAHKCGLIEKDLSEVDILYILLTDNEEITDNKIVLTDLCKGGRHYLDFLNSIREDRRELWKQISEILLICAHRFDDIDTVKKDALEKSKGIEHGEKFFELIRFMCRLNNIARTEGVLAIEEAVIPPELALNEFVSQAREEFMMMPDPDELLESLADQYWVNNWQGENALLGYMIIIAFVDIARGKNIRALEQKLVSCLNETSQREYAEKYDRKSAAAARMRDLGVPDEIIKEFTENGVIDQCKSNTCEYSPLREEQLAFARKLEADYAITVFMVIHSSTAIGDLDVYLYVGYGGNFIEECEIPKHGQAAAYFHSVTGKEYSEFCKVGIEKLPNGGLRCSRKIV